MDAPAKPSQVVDSSAGLPGVPSALAAPVNPIYKTLLSGVNWSPPVTIRFLMLKSASTAVTGKVHIANIDHFKELASRYMALVITQVAVRVHVIKGSSYPSYITAAIVPASGAFANAVTDEDLVVRPGAQTVGTNVLSGEAHAFTWTSAPYADFVLFPNVTGRDPVVYALTGASSTALIYLVLEVTYVTGGVGMAVGPSLC
jgi:hypothetical protein